MSYFITTCVDYPCFILKYLLIALCTFHLVAIICNFKTINHTLSGADPGGSRDPPLEIY